MTSVVRGFRSGLSLFRTNPAAAVSGTVALALGIGFSSTMFSIVHGGTRGLPFADAASIVAVERLGARAGAFPSSTLRDYRLWARESRMFAGLAAFQSAAVNLGGPERPSERVAAAAVTPGAFSLLGIQPVRGRGMVEQDAGSNREAVVILSHALWTRRFDRDHGAIGRTVRVDGAPHTVIGVMPEGFGFPINATLWTVLGRSESTSDDEPVQVFGRLAPASGKVAAGEELLSLSRAGAETDEQRSAVRLRVIDFIEIETPRQVQWGLYLLLIATSGVLGIACVNVANLFIVRAASRARDVAVRLALGAGRRTILVEQSAESLVLSTIGAAGGVWIAWMGTRAFRLGTADILEAFWMDFRLDATVIAYAAVLAVASAAAAAVLPALRASRTDIAATLRDGAMGSSIARLGRLSRGLLAGQIALACSLLAFTLLLGGAAVALYTRPWPFNPDLVLAAQIGVPQATLDQPEERARLLTRLEDALRDLSGADGAALTSVFPGRGAGNWTFSFDGAANDPARMPSTGVTMVSATYFETLPGRVVRGRGISPMDRAGAPTVAVVNESFVARFSRDRDPIGRRLFVGARETTIVGVVADLMAGDVDASAQDGIYVSIHQLRPYAIRVVARGRADPRLLLHPLRTVIDRIDPDLPLYEASTVREAAMREKQVLGVLSRLFGMFGSGALLLTAIGLYSVTAFSVALRRREFGIRIALGATRIDLVRLVVGLGLRQLTIGLIIGLALALLLTRAFSAAVEFAAGDSSGVLATIAAAIIATFALAMVGPVLAGSRIDPMKALHEA